MLKNILIIITLFIVGMAGGIFAEQIFWPYFIERPLLYQYKLEQAPVYVTETKQSVVQENVALTNAIEDVEKIAVGVRTKLKTGKVLEGSGLIVSSDGLAVTFANLVPEGGQTTLFWEGEKPSFQILKRDSKVNLALIKIEKSSLPTVGFADADSIKLGERVFLVGIIFGTDATPGKITNEGIIKTFDDNQIKTNIFEKSNLSGSPLFDIEGKVLGLNAIDSEGKVIAVSAKKIREFIGF